MSFETVQLGDCTLIRGDCLEVLPTLEAGSVDAVVTDPPYGMKWNGKVTRGKNGTGKKGSTGNYGKIILNDDKPFDPSPFLIFSQIIMWGFIHFSNKLPLGSALVWVKRYDTGFGTFLSDADIAWMKGGEGIYCYRDLSLQGESKNKEHPTQKPLSLMRWCLKWVSNTGNIVFDPFMGSGTTGVACVQTGRRFIGIEIDQGYFDIAVKRIKEAQLQIRMEI